MTEILSITPPLKSTRSRITNGSTLHGREVDGRSALAKRYRDVLSAIVNDLGGPDRLSEGERQLARRASTMAVQCEAMEAAAVAGGKLDLDAFGMLSDRLGRCLQRLGLRRVSRDITPDLKTYLAHVVSEVSE